MCTLNLVFFAHACYSVIEGETASLKKLSWHYLLRTLLGIIILVIHMWLFRVQYPTKYVNIPEGKHEYTANAGYTTARTND